MRISGLMLVSGLLLSVAVFAQAGTVTMNGNVLVGSASRVPSSGSPYVQGSYSAGKDTYDFTGANSLDMSTCNFTRSGSGECLILTNLAATGGVSIRYSAGGGSLNTYGVNQRGGDIRVYVSGDVQLLNVVSYNNGFAGSGDSMNATVTIISGGAVTLDGYLNACGMGWGTHAGDVVIRAPRFIVINGYDLGTGVSINNYQPGGGNGDYYDGRISLITTGAVTLARGINSRRSQGGSGQWVVIQGDDAGALRAGAVSVGGSIETWTYATEAASSAWGGKVSIRSSGAISIASNIVSYVGYKRADGGDVWLDAQGAVTVGGYIRAELVGDGDNRNPLYHGGSVAITGTVVKIQGMDSNSISVRTGGYGITADAGPVSITATAGDVDIQGGIDSYGSHTNGSVAVSATGKITVGYLDVGRVKYAAIDAKEATISVVTNFNTNTGANTALRAPADTVIWYDSNITTNAYLQGKRYWLASLAGVPELGGALKSFRNRSTVIVLR